MAKRNEDNRKHWGFDSSEWGYALRCVFLGSIPLLFLFYWFPFLSFVLPIFIPLDVVVVLLLAWGWWIALSRSWEEDERVKKEEEAARPPVRYVDPVAEAQALVAEIKDRQKQQAEAPYKKIEMELSARLEHAKRMQTLEALRRQVEEEERKAGIFVPTLPPAQPQSGPRPSPSASSTPAVGKAPAPSASTASASAPADPIAAEMARLAQRHQEAERQSHLLKSLRAVEDAEWKADDV